MSLFQDHDSTAEQVINNLMGHAMRLSKVAPGEQGLKAQELMVARALSYHTAAMAILMAHPGPLYNKLIDRSDFMAMRKLARGS